MTGAIGPLGGSQHLGYMLLLYESRKRRSERSSQASSQADCKISSLGSHACRVRLARRHLTPSAAYRRPLSTSVECYGVRTQDFNEVASCTESTRIQIDSRTRTMRPTILNGHCWIASAIAFDDEPKEARTARHGPTTASSYATDPVRL